MCPLCVFVLFSAELQQQTGQGLGMFWKHKDKVKGVWKLFIQTRGQYCLLDLTPSTLSSADLLTFVFEVLQNGDDGFQRDTVSQKQLPGAILLKRLPVQRLNCGHTEKRTCGESECCKHLQSVLECVFLTEDVENGVFPEHHQVPHHHMTHQLL